MYCVRKVTDDIYWVGGNDRRLMCFEGVYDVPRGVSYNSYLLLDEKTVLFDTVDKAVAEVFFENVEHVLAGRTLDYVVVHHMEPDHSATLCELVRRYPDVKIVCNSKMVTMIKQYFTFDIDSHAVVVEEGGTFSSGKHSFTFINAPMVHWPEVMFTYDAAAKILFSADAFGMFGALDGALFADEVDFERDHLDEARRYYTNIVGKYGLQVTNALKKAAAFDIQMVCPLHGYVWRKNIGWFIDKYMKWASYEPEEKGVVIAYSSVYGHTANAADTLACLLGEQGVKTVVYDVSVTAESYIISDIFKYSHVVFAATTYNMGVFIKMENLLHDLVEHGIQNRSTALIENGTWAPQSGRLMKELLSSCKGFRFLNEKFTLKSSMKEEQMGDLRALADTIAQTVKNE